MVNTGSDLATGQFLHNLKPYSILSLKGKVISCTNKIQIEVLSILQSNFRKIKLKLADFLNTKMRFTHIRIITTSDEINVKFGLIK